MAHALLLSLLLAAQPASTPVEEPGTAQLPLSELLRLHQAADHPSAPAPEAPPVPAVVERLEISGLLLDDAAELTAHVEARVFSEAWTVLPLLKQDASLHVLAIPHLEQATLSTSS